MDIAVCNQNYHTATGNHMPYGGTRCYLPPGSLDFAAFTPAKSCTRFCNPRSWTHSLKSRVQCANHYTTEPCNNSDLHECTVVSSKWCCRVQWRRYRRWRRRHKTTPVARWQSLTCSQCRAEQTSSRMPSLPTYSTLNSTASVTSVSTSQNTCRDRSNSTRRQVLLDTSTQFYIMKHFWSTT